MLKRCLMAVLVLTTLSPAARVWGVVDLPGTITFDFHWMNPPRISPQMEPVDVDSATQELQLPGRAREIIRYEWALRYPVQSEYRLLTLRYRARGLDGQVLNLEMGNGNEISSILPALDATDLRQDGTVQILQKELALPAGTAIEALRFEIASGDRPGRLDVYEFQLQQMEGAPPAFHQTVVFRVDDLTGLPLAGAEVRFGMLEREEWTAVGTTSEDGQVTLSAPLDQSVLTAPALATGSSRPLEAVVIRDGYISQYLAPIPADLQRPLVLQMQPSRLATTGSITSLPPSDVIERVDELDDGLYNHDVRYDPWYYRRPYYGYRAFPYGFACYVVVIPDKDHKDHKHTDHHDRRRPESKSPYDHFKNRPAPPSDIQSPPRLVPWNRPPRQMRADLMERPDQNRGPSVPVDLRRRYVQARPPRWADAPISVRSRPIPPDHERGFSLRPDQLDRPTARPPHEGFVRSPESQTMGAPRFGPISAPRSGIISAPRTGLISAPRTGLVSAPRNGVISAPRFEDAPTRRPTGLGTHSPTRRDFRQRRMMPGPRDSSMNPGIFDAGNAIEGDRAVSRGRDTR